MPIQFQEPGHKLLGIKVSGKLTDADYKAFVPRLEQAIAEVGEVRILIDITGFEGMDAHALWDDLKVALKHAHAMARVAVVGNRTWEEWMTKIGGMLMRSDVRYFEPNELEAARIWLREGLSET
ncbi:MAG TPA: STAS/SEC14 domain-containing protein [Oscillatoriaceae cyanobacterium]